MRAISAIRRKERRTTKRTCAQETTETTELHPVTPFEQGRREDGKQKRHCPQHSPRNTRNRRNPRTRSQSAGRGSSLASFIARSSTRTSPRWGLRSGVKADMFLTRTPTPPAGGSTSDKPRYRRPNPASKSRSRRVRATSWRVASGWLWSAASGSVRYAYCRAISSADQPRPW